MAVDFALRRFRLYLVGAPNDTIIITDHHPLLSVFNGKRNGSNSTDRIKLRHDIPLETLSKNQKNESADLTNLLYPFHVIPILDTIAIKEIAKETNNDPILKDLRDIILSAKLYIPNDKPHPTPYKQIIAVLNNGTLLNKTKQSYHTLYMKRTYVCRIMDPTQNKMF